jgi:hypothetical protein
MSRAEPGSRSKPVRELCLRRRRSRLPWVYIVYHRAGRPAGFATFLPADVDTPIGMGGQRRGSALPARTPPVRATKETDRAAADQL